MANFTASQKAIYDKIRSGITSFTVDTAIEDKMEQVKAFQPVIDDIKVLIDNGIISKPSYIKEEFDGIKYVVVINSCKLIKYV